MKKYIYLSAICFCLSACTSTSDEGRAPTIQSKTQGLFKVGSPYQVSGRWYTPKETYTHTEVGVASWYGPGFDGKRTANGEVFSTQELTAAHRTLQMPSLIRVTNLANNRSIIVRVNDRGPFSKERIIDVSGRAAELLGFKHHGTAKVKLELLAEPSRTIADAAKRGVSTKGTEIAMNQNRPLSSHPGIIPASLGNRPDPMLDPPPSVTMAEAAQLKPQEKTLAAVSEVPGNVNRGRFLPDPVVINRNRPGRSIYVQAGAFGNPGNARSLSERLRSIAPTSVIAVNVHGTQFHRVRLGPFTNMADAKIALDRVEATGQSNAAIVVD